ncbi:hypothetical protein BABINDRAFT_160160 [Babjeviella inositovora NRRL Y-12698]|uniref:Uncharacterized protein n=1 Tax=Babjeviella inositovora NRRL Y-12698 TaxID=984486 RepID=A0A1E3QWA3_9ASCO|nr:uncharacterized protein BABINDRAFT_160160 [Babjeviella inositovora NRRL Y-12698]ODQ81938.1 hypothetical protein BABINDRAFT_160160 [Babjeviella inositovora NRRL Y-12698]
MQGMHPVLPSVLACTFLHYLTGRFGNFEPQTFCLFLNGDPNKNICRSTTGKSTFVDPTISLSRMLTFCKGSAVLRRGRPNSYRFVHNLYLCPSTYS